MANDREEQYIARQEGYLDTEDRLREQMKRQTERIRLMQEQAWSDGFQACKRGVQEFRNPFRPPSDDDVALDRANLG